MRQKPMALGAVVLVTGLAVAAWFSYRPLLARHYVSQLEKVPAGEADACINRVAKLGAAAVPRLAELLRDDAPACTHAGQTLAIIVGAWPAGDPQASELAKRLTADFRSMSAGGRRAALGVVEPLLKHRAVCKELVHAGLKDGTAANRELAVVLAMRKEVGLASAVVPLMSDEVAEVRRAAMIAVGTSPELVPDEDLLPWLHDPDPGVCELCESTLLARGLRERDVRMGKLVTDSSFLTRLEVIGYLQHDDQVDRQVWLNRLSRDPVPAVRAAAARVGVEPEWKLSVDFLPRVKEMAQSDPDGTVRQIAAALIQMQSRLRPEKLPESFR